MGSFDVLMRRGNSVRVKINGPKWLMNANMSPSDDMIELRTDLTVMIFDSPASYNIASGPRLVKNQDPNSPSAVILNGPVSLYISTSATTTLYLEYH